MSYPKKSYNAVTDGKVGKFLMGKHVVNMLAAIMAQKKGDSLSQGPVSLTFNHEPVCVFQTLKDDCN
jgi:hypothetical protein